MYIGNAIEEWRGWLCVDVYSVCYIHVALPSIQ